VIGDGIRAPAPDGPPAAGEEGRVKTKELLVACFVVFVTLLVWPVLSIPNRLALVAGVPALVLYLFAVWGLIVAVLAWASRRAGGEEGP
jgi:apolipoprotein N-acyltransferase